MNKNIVINTVFGIKLEFNENVSSYLANVDVIYFRNFNYVIW